jgi:hypothetical protein
VFPEKSFAIFLQDLPENSHYEEPQSSSDTYEGKVRRTRRSYRSDAERMEAKRQRDAEYRERQRLKKMAASPATPGASMATHSEDELAFNSQLSVKSEDQDFVQSFVQGQML